MDALAKVIDRFNEDSSLYDEIEMFNGEDNHGEHYTVFEDWDSHNKFVDLAKETLELDDDVADYQIEKMLETNFVFSDEYTTCDDCGKIVRTSPDSYHWQPDFYVGDGFIACGVCFDNNEDYQEDYLKEKINSPKNAINGLITDEQLEGLGFKKMNQDSYENGFHRWQTDSPQEIYDELTDSYEEIVFMVDGVGQFDVHFSVWVRGEY